ncbi:MAG: hypothetical protein JXA17_08525 [Dehalococcoidales bacterium]|nr:hypothetical protein [Dehalococcoidales bacterium]
MKMAISFICGVVICFLILYGVKPVLPAFAEEAPLPDESENVTQSLVGLITDIEKIYREALTTPFIQAESEIYDEDIADFYHALMEKTGLTDPDSN